MAVVYQKIDKKFPLRFSIGALFVIYVVQYPMSQLLFPSKEKYFYSDHEWLVAYFFVILSSIAFLIMLRFSLGGGRVPIQQLAMNVRARTKIPFWLATAIIAFFAGWSYLMVALHIGMTIHIDFTPLPFRLVGLLYYGRLFIQPFILMYIANSYRYSYKRWIILLLLVALGAWAAAASGSRFISLMFSLPLFFLFSGKKRWVFLVAAALLFINIATLSRHFYLPYVIGGDMIQIYANAEYQAAVTQNLWLIPFEYISVRMMGIGEVLMTFHYGEITPSFPYALQRLLATFIPFVDHGAGASIKNIYGLDDSALGGFGLDFFSNYWVMFGGTVPTYTIGLLLMAWLFGATHRTLATAMLKIGGKEYIFAIYILLFLLVFEGRIALFPYIYIAGWFAKQPFATKAYRRLSNTFLRRRRSRQLHNMASPS